MKLVLIGAPGSGKGTLAKNLSQKYHLSHISTGDMIRTHIKNKTEIGLQVKEVLERGALVSDALMQKLVETTLTDKENTGYILDGFPRTIDQTKWFMDKFEVDTYIVFDISNDTVIERISGRRIHPASNRIYHITFAPPKTADKDDISGEPLIQREDDKAEKVLHRLEVYEKQTLPIIHYIETHSNNCIHIDAEQNELAILNEVLAFGITD